MNSSPAQPLSFRSPPAGPLALPIAQAQVRPTPGTDRSVHVPEWFRFVPEVSRGASGRSLFRCDDLGSEELAKEGSLRFVGNVEDDVGRFRS